MALRWGIASAAKISHDFVNDLNLFPKEEHKVIAVAARNLDRAKDFATTHTIPTAYGSYEELARNDDVEIVYIGALNPQHYEIAMLMLSNAKHVLCETPLCVNEKQAKKLIDFAKQKKLFLMEALWSRFLPSYEYVRSQIDSGALGDIKEVKVSFGFDLRSVERLTKKNLGGGSFMDLGNFTIQFSQWIFQKAPETIKAIGKLNNDGCDMSVNAELFYPCGGKTTLTTSAEEMLENRATVIGTKGTITFPEGCWNPKKLIDVDGKEKSWNIQKGQHDMNFPGTMGMRFQAEHVRKCIREGKLESDVASLEESLVIARIEDEIRKQIGVVYDQDDIL